MSSHGKVPTMKDLRNNEAKREISFEAADEYIQEHFRDLTVFERTPRAEMMLRLLKKHGALPRPLLAKALKLAGLAYHASCGGGVAKTLYDEGYIKAEKRTFRMRVCVYYVITDKGLQKLEELDKCQKKKT